MLTRLTLQNYRGLEKHTIDLKDVTIVVGRNNAGKSTLVEALRLISIVTERINGIPFQDPPEWTDLRLVERGARPQTDSLRIDFSTVCYQYGEAPAIVEALFDSGEKIRFYINAEGQSHVLIWKKSGRRLRSRPVAQRISFPSVDILPQLSPLASTERVLSEDYVKENLYSTLSSLHFRNQLRNQRGPYLEFRKLAEETWPRLQIQELSGMMGERGQHLHLNVRDRAFVGEVARMGHGLQIWLQIMWFLVRTPKDASVVLDEPDLYMHPDLQRRLIQIVKRRFPQVILATHSVEIMAEVAPSKILIIDRHRETSGYADDDPMVQSLIEHLGGVHNIHLARLANANRCLLVEGKDYKFLKLVHDLLYATGTLGGLEDDDQTYDTGWVSMPDISIGGWGGWQYAVGSALYIRNSVGSEVTVYCVLDSDFHTDREIAQRLSDAADKGVNLHIWRRKEIENYFLVSPAIARVINGKRKEDSEEVTSEEIRDRLRSIANAIREKTTDDLAAELDRETRGDYHGATNAARLQVQDAFDGSTGGLAIVSGKKVLGQLSEWSKREYGVSLGAANIIRAMKPEEVHPEIRRLVEQIHERKPIPKEAWKREA
ncbi:MAG: AAA family ATPase [Acidobacteriota bacterium]|nr:AAA family ATPase [Acidobacteriota bacterium]